MPRKARLDAELVRRKLARSREHAGELIEAGRVTVRGFVARKSATSVEDDASIVVADDVEDPKWASRGAYKLLGALEAFEKEGLRVEGRRCLDAGASTGGFTDVLLRRRAEEVVAVDVGYGQLDWKLRTDERVTVRERKNVRSLTPEDVGEAADLVVADLSFISLRLVLPALSECVHRGSDLVLMVKPQFEVGKERLGAGGVVRDPALRAEAVLGVVAAAAEYELRLQAVVASPLPGPSGNVEYFVWLHRRGDQAPRDVTTMVTEAVTVSSTDVTTASRSAETDTESLGGDDVG
ncbi:TlyA family RNA methyltransferase [Actinopolyspora erythraea]|uniref:TlyA family RNA methyltransferase n=1 Tax=Actinopolyspora erythraea TaxID=414996 RepID=A0A223RRS0_9ACTN|nr:TlyA family RNA methyltransferase [Actinopolyspora erythraea]ASU78551.1 TlyA family RNA methyltransferase [Actinopolyspora erythraea]